MLDSVDLYKSVENGLVITANQLELMDWTEDKIELVGYILDLHIHNIVISRNEFIAHLHGRLKRNVRLLTCNHHV